MCGEGGSVFYRLQCVQFGEPHALWPYKKPQHTCAAASKSFLPKMPMANILAKIFAELCDLQTVRQGKSFSPASLGASSVCGGRGRVCVMQWNLQLLPLSTKIPRMPACPH